MRGLTILLLSLRSTPLKMCVRCVLLVRLGDIWNNSSDLLRKQKLWRVISRSCFHC